MNDFSLAELKEIRSCVYYEGYDDQRAINANQPLLDKIDSIIRNYCNHKIHTGVYPRSNPPKKCHECGELYFE